MLKVCNKKIPINSRLAYSSKSGLAFNDNLKTTNIVTFRNEHTGLINVESNLIPKSANTNITTGNKNEMCCDIWSHLNQCQQLLKQVKGNNFLSPRMRTIPATIHPSEGSNTTSKFIRTPSNNKSENSGSNCKKSYSTDKKNTARDDKMSLTSLNFYKPCENSVSIMSSRQFIKPKTQQKQIFSKTYHNGFKQYMGNTMETKPNVKTKNNVKMSQHAKYSSQIPKVSKKSINKNENIKSEMKDLKQNKEYLEDKTKELEQNSRDSVLEFEKLEAVCKLEEKLETKYNVGTKENLKAKQKTNNTNPELKDEIEKLKKDKDTLMKIKEEYESLLKKHRADVKNFTEEKSKHKLQLEDELKLRSEKLRLLEQRLKTQFENNKRFNDRKKSENNELAKIKKQLENINSENQLLEKMLMAKSVVITQNNLQKPLRKNSSVKTINNEQKTSYDMVFPDKYHTKSAKLISNKVQKDERIKTFSNGKIETIFHNGVRRETFPDGYTVIYFANKDIRQVYPNGIMIYYNDSNKTTHTNFPDGLQIIKHHNGQVEKNYLDGTKEIMYVLVTNI